MCCTVGIELGFALELCARHDGSGLSLFHLDAAGLDLLVSQFDGFLFGFLAGFPTAITLLDIPFSRRQWSTSQRIAFVRKNFLPVTAFGSICGLLFVIPVLGPLVMVPSASVGGLWLICRFDKSALRPAPPVDTAA